MENYNIAHTLAEMAKQQPEQIGLVEKVFGGHRSWTFRELDEHASAYAHGLKSIGITSEDRTILMVRPSMDFICLTFALFRLGAPVILIDPGMGYHNLLRCIASVKPTAFIGVPKAHLFRLINYYDFFSVSKTVCVGPGLGLLGKSLKGLADFTKGPFPARDTQREDLAAIIFTTGSTGPPKGVQYQHGNFSAQLELIRDYYKLTPDDIDQPAFPLFALFSTALGATAVVPAMDPARPAKVNPELFIKSIIERKVTYSFGSPAIWNVVSRYCLDQGIRLNSLRLVLMAGAPVPGELVERVKQIIAEDGEIHTPYGATESLPVTSISGREIMAETWPLSRVGKGTCVGRPLPGIELKIIKMSDGPLHDWSEVAELPLGEVGEIVVRGGVVTTAYYNNVTENGLAKISDNGTFWHRLGDLGYLDAENRLWFCGRKAHRVETADGVMFTIPCEAIFNEHPTVYRAALVGVKGKGPKDIPVMIVEPNGRCDQAQLLAELQKLAKTSVLSSRIEHFLINDEFPVDIRHNAKIFREKLAVWAAKELEMDSA
ncbi:MAG: fatty acid CoA ligase family protein [Thermodesulfobacteriota bacterium]